MLPHEKTDENSLHAAPQVVKFYELKRRVLNHFPAGITNPFADGLKLHLLEFLSTLAFLQYT